MHAHSWSLVPRFEAAAEPEYDLSIEEEPTGVVSRLTPIN
jgi:hypothetical protein